MIAMDFGCFFITSASRLVITSSPSTSSPGMRRERQPVATRMFLAERNLPLSGPLVTSTIPGTEMCPVPSRYSTLFFLKRNSIPPAMRSLTLRERAMTFAKSTV